MKLFKVESPTPVAYDEFQAMVCAAENEVIAREICPSDGTGNMDEDDSYKYWGCPLSGLTVTYIGEAAEGIEEGVVCADFNAG